MTTDIVCLKWGDLYGPSYVNKLFWGFKRNTTVPFDFHCFTEKPEEIHPDVFTHSLPHHLPGVGWWQKLYLFSKEIPVKGRIFYVDLDTLITGNVDDLISYDKGFVCLRDLFLARMSHNYRDKFGTAKEAVGSGVLSWEAGRHSHLWESFMRNPIAAVRSLHPHGDQKWIQKHEPKRTYWQDIFPNRMVSFKVHCRNGLAKNARIVCYHGKPSIPESINTTTRVQGYTIKPTPWVRKYWFEGESPSSPAPRQDLKDDGKQRNKKKKTATATQTPAPSPVAEAKTEQS
jgi:hypothetical protein